MCTCSVCHIVSGRKAVRLYKGLSAQLFAAKVLPLERVSYFGGGQLTYARGGPLRVVHQLVHLH